MSTLTVELPQSLSPERARLLLAVRLFEEGDVSLGYAAELAGLGLAAFAERLAARGIAAVDHPAADLDADLDALRSLDTDAPGG